MVDFYTPLVNHKIRTWCTDLLNTLLTTLNLNGSVKQIFRTWVFKAVDTVHQADTDGIVTAIGHITEDNKWLTAYGRTDANPSPVLIRCALSATRTADSESRPGSFSMPVKKGDYWEVYKYNNTGTYSLSCYWLPIGE